MKDLKKEYIEKLRNDETYRSALSKARNDEERKAISNFVESMVGEFANILGLAHQEAENDPTFVEKLKEALVKNEVVVTDNDPNDSGSKK